MNRPLIVCALEDEFNLKTEKTSLLHTGVGKVNAAISLTEYILSNDKLSHVINYGTAGSKKIKVGTIVDCTKFIQRDMDASKIGFDLLLGSLRRLALILKLESVLSELILINLT